MPRRQRGLSLQGGMASVRGCVGRQVPHARRHLPRGPEEAGRLQDLRPGPAVGGPSGGGGHARREAGVHLHLWRRQEHEQGRRTGVDAHPGRGGRWDGRRRGPEGAEQSEGEEQVSDGRVVIVDFVPSPPSTRTVCPLWSIEISGSLGENLGVFAVFIPSPYVAVLFTTLDIDLLYSLMPYALFALHD